MKKAMQVLGVIAVMTLIGGCASHTSRSSNEFAALTMLRPLTDSDAGDQETYFLGAGDALGRAVFANYVAYVRENGAYDPQRYASGESLRR